MKFFRLATILLMATIINTSLAYGHSGRTDSQGGHYNRQTGGYHYHNGGSSSSNTSSYTSTNTTQNVTTSKPVKVEPVTKYVNLSVNGEIIDTEAKPFLNNDARTMVWIVDVANTFNATTSWDSSTNTVTVKKDDTIIKVKIGDNKINVNGENIMMDTKAIIKDGRTYLPISAIAKAFNVSYTWDNDTSAININIK